MTGGEEEEFYKIEDWLVEMRVGGGVFGEERQGLEL